MNFKNIGLSAAIAATTTLGVVAMTAPAEAAILVGSRLNLQNLARGGVSFLPGGTSAVLDFEGPAGGQGVGVGASTGSFAGATSLPTPIARIQDLTLASLGGGQWGFSGNLANFLSGIDLPGIPGGDDLQFDLTQFVFNEANGDASIEGIFRQGSTSIAGLGRFTSQTELGNPSSYSLTITAVPTPALLPGLIGMGLAALRKRKGEGAEQLEEVKA